MGVGVLEGGSVPVASARRRPRRGLAAKRAIDVVVSAFVLLLLAPLLAILALAILIADGRPIFFRQRRVGRHGELFTIYKFRTMVPDAHERLGELAHANERGGPLFKASDDPRVTRIGKLLRRTSLDELPQFFNVLTGTMSLVGPRPSLPEERADFPAELLEREDLPQGLTGLWQVEGRDDHDFAVYRDLDLQYVRDWSLRRDLWILVRTPFVVVRHALRGEGPGPVEAVAPDPIVGATTAPRPVADGACTARPVPVGPLETPSWDGAGRARVPSTLLASTAVGHDD